LFKHSKKRRSVGVAVVLAAAVAAFGAYAFTAGNTFDPISAGAGSTAVTGYAISNEQVQYDADGTHVVGVTFNLDKAASDVKAALVAAPVAADWTDCGASAAVTFAVTCTFDGTGTPNPVAVDNFVKLSVAAVSNGTVTTS